MEPQQTTKEKNGQFNVSELNRVTAISKYLAAALFVVLPFLGAWIGYQYAKSYSKPVVIEKTVTVISPVEEVPKTKKPAMISDGFMLEATPLTTDVNPETKVFAKGIYVDTSIGCSEPDSAGAMTEFDRIKLDRLVTVVGEGVPVTEVLKCWWAGGGQTYFLYNMLGWEKGVNTRAFGVVRVQTQECPPDLKNCSPYGDVKQIWPTVKD